MKIQGFSSDASSFAPSYVDFFFDPCELNIVYVYFLTKSFK